MYQAPRGTVDILPPEMPYWRYVERAIANISRLYGYQRIDTPIFEDTGLFSRSTGEFTDIVQKEMYTFDDRGGNSLTLKPEGTPPVCRAYIQHGLGNLPQPVKLYYISPIFRYDRPQAGRYRQHYQFGGEAIGDADPSLDAEVIDMAWQFFKSLGLARISLQLNSIGCKTCRPGYLAVLKDYYNGYAARLCQDCKTRLERNPLRLLDCKQTSCQEIAVSAPKNASHLCQECSEHFKKLQKYLGRLGVPFELNHRLVRGLDYYTRTVFEIQPEGEAGAQSTIGGGGRYDDLIQELGGKPTPAIGFATGIERIILNLKKESVPVPALPPPQVFIAYLGDKARESAISLAANLRRSGLSALGMPGRSLKSQLRQANALGVLYSVIIGEDEVATGTVQLREMATGEQKTVTASELEKIVKESVGSASL